MIAPAVLVTHPAGQARRTPLPIDFLLDLPCPVKEALGREGLLSALKARGTAADLLASYERSEGTTPDPAGIEVQFWRRAPEGDEVQHAATAADLLSEAAALEEQAAHCAACPARVAEVPFGCVGQMRYPLRGATEEWLLTLLPDTLASTAGAYAMRCFDDGPFDGRALLVLRKQAPVFESRYSAMRQWEGTGVYVTSEQLLQVLFFNAAITPADAVKLALLLGLIPHHTPRAEVERALDDPSRRGELLDQGHLPEPPPGDRGPVYREQGATQIRQAILFLRAVALAARLDVSLLLDA